MSCQDQAIQYWIRAGAPREKINVGIGTYGHTFTLSTSAQCVIGAPATGAGLAGPYTREAGTLGYNEVHYIKLCDTQLKNYMSITRSDKNSEQSSGKDRGGNVNRNVSLAIHIYINSDGINT